MNRLIIFMVILTLSACNDDPQTAIIGKWEGVSVPQDFHYYQGGQAELIDRKHGNYDGNCHFSDTDELTCHFDRFNFPVIRKVKVSGTKLSLSNKNGQEEIYHRK